MAGLSGTPVAPLDYATTLDADMDETGDKDVRNGATTLFAFDLKSAATAAIINYLKFYDDRNPSFGTDLPDLIIPVKATERVRCSILPSGLAFANGLSVEADGTEGDGNGTTTEAGKDPIVHLTTTI